MPCIPVPPQPLPAEIADLFSETSESPVTSPPLPGGLVPPWMGSILSAHAPQRSGGGMAQGAVEVWYPDTGSIATFTSGKKPQFNEIVFAVNKKYPLKEVGTGKLKFHDRDDGTSVTFCGTIRPDLGGNVAACRNKPHEHKIIGIPNSCKRRACPECYPYWSKKAGQRVSSVLNGFIRLSVPESLQEQVCEALQALPEDANRLQIESVFQDTDRYLPRHVVFSPDQETLGKLILKTEAVLLKRWGPGLKNDSWKYANEFHKIFQKKLRRKLDQIVQSAGVYAYVEIGHDIRLKDNKESKKADHDCDTNRYRKILDQPAWRYNVKFSPHSHIMAFGALENAEAFHKRTGWIYRNYGIITNVGGLTSYLLSHAPDIEGMHSIRYCGDLNPTKMAVVGEVKIPHLIKCVECIEEGRSSEDALMVIAKLASVEYQKDASRHMHLASWTFSDEQLSDKPYRTLQVIQIYQRRSSNRCVGVGTDPPLNIASWLSEEEKAEQLRQWKLLKSERDRVRKAEQWVPWSDWVRFSPEDRERFKWRQYYTPEDYAELSAEEKLKFFEWI